MQNEIIYNYSPYTDNEYSKIAESILSINCRFLQLSRVFDYTQGGTDIHELYIIVIHLSMLLLMACCDDGFCWQYDFNIHEYITFNIFRYTFGFLIACWVVV